MSNFINLQTEAFLEINFPEYANNLIHLWNQNYNLQGLIDGASGYYNSRYQESEEYNLAYNKAADLVAGKLAA